MKTLCAVLLLAVLSLPCVAQQKTSVFTIPAKPLSEAADSIFGEFQLFDPATKITKYKITASPSELQIPKADQRFYYTKAIGGQTFLGMALAPYSAEFELKDDTLIIKAKKSNHVIDPTRYARGS